MDILKERGHRTVDVLSRQRFTDMVTQAVKTAILQLQQRKVSTEILEAESKKEFGELLEQYQSAQRIQSQLAGTREELHSELEELRRELARAKEAANTTLTSEEEKRQVLTAKEFEVQAEKLLAGILDRMEKDGRNAVNVDALRQAFLPIARKLVAEQADIVRKSMGSGNRLVALMERRIEKLYDHIRKLEAVLRDLSRQKVYSSAGIASILRSVGLAPEDENYKKKAGMLKGIVEQNVKLREELKKLAGGERPPPG